MDPLNALMLFWCTCLIRCVIPTFRGLARSGRGTGGPSRRGGRGGRRGQEKSAADLDAELEVYHAEAMQQS